MQNQVTEDVDPPIAAGSIAYVASDIVESQDSDSDTLGESAAELAARQSAVDELSESANPLRAFTPAVLRVLSTTLLTRAARKLQLATPTNPTQYQVAKILDDLTIFREMPPPNDTDGDDHYVDSFLDFVDDITTKNRQHEQESKIQANEAATIAGQLYNVQDTSNFFSTGNPTAPAAPVTQRTAHVQQPQTTSEFGLFARGINDLVQVMKAGNQISNPLQDLDSLDPICPLNGLRASILKTLDQGLQVSVALAFPQPIHQGKASSVRKRQIPPDKASFMQVLGLIAVYSPKSPQKTLKAGLLTATTSPRLMTKSAQPAPMPSTPS